MGVTKSYYTGTTLSTTTLDNPDDGSGATLTMESDAFATTMEATLGAVSDGDDAMMLEAGGDATAIGEDTLAAGSVSASLEDHGGVTIATADSTFTAIAVDGDGAYAGAYSYAYVDGADITVTSTSASSDLIITDEATLAYATSSTSLRAIDIEMVDLDSPLVVDTSVTDTTDAVPDDGITDGTTSGGSASADIYSLDGNTSLLFVDASVTDDTTALQVDAFSLSMEDQLSISSAIVIAEAG